MKKKSLFGFSAKLALMLVAICGMFASCYEKEDLTVDGPSTVSPVYKIAGVISNAITGEPIVGAKVNNTTTKADGTYEMTVNAGMNVVTVSMADYKTTTTSVFVETLENGKTAVYTVNAALYPGKTNPTYKSVKYSINGIANNTAGAKVALKSVVIAGIANVTVADNTFSAEDLRPGSYAAVLTATNYNKTYTTINVAPVVAQEGEGEQKAVTTITVLMQKPGEQARYIIKGELKNEEGKAVTGAIVKVSTNNEFTENTISDNNGMFSIEIPFEYITPTTMASISITKNGYISVKKNVLVTPKEEGSVVYAFDGTITMEAINDVPEEPEQGGDATVEIPIENSKPIEVEEALKDETVKSGIETVAEELGIDLKTIENIPVLAVEKASTIELVSSESVIDQETGETTGEVKKVADQITIPAETKIYYVAGVAENISLKRDITTEKITNAARVYQGQPAGAVFSKPLEIAFQPQTTITVKPDYVMGVLYLNEKTNTWVADKGNYAEYDMTSQSFIGKINHFSTFKFGFVSEIVAKDSINLAKEYIEKPCYTGSSSATATVKGTYLGGAAYKGNTPALAAAAALKGMNAETINYVTALLNNMIKADNANIMPKNNYTPQEVSVSITIPAYKQVNGFNMERKQVTKTYTVHVIDKDKKSIDVNVSVNKIISVTLQADLAIGHTHGHGTGAELNAGGGIIDFE